jgi:hypothetical protein
MVEYPSASDIRPGWTYFRTSRYHAEMGNGLGDRGCGIFHGRRLAASIGSQ